MTKGAGNVRYRRESKFAGGGENRKEEERNISACSLRTSPARLQVAGTAKKGGGGSTERAFCGACPDDKMLVTSGPGEEKVGRLSIHLGNDPARRRRKRTTGTSNFSGLMGKMPVP